MEGSIVLVPDLDHHTVKLVITGVGTISTEVPILIQEQDTSSYVSSWTSIEETEKINYNSEQGLAAFCFGKRAVSIPIEDFEQHSLDNTYNEYMYYFSVSFEK